MKELEKLLDRIIQRNNINLRELDYDDFEAAIAPMLQMLGGGSVWHVYSSREEATAAVRTSRTK